MFYTIKYPTNMFSPNRPHKTMWNSIPNFSTPMTTKLSFPRSKRINNPLQHHTMNPNRESTMTTYLLLLDSEIEDDQPIHQIF